MLKGEATASRAGPLHRGTTKIVVQYLSFPNTGRQALVGLTIWPRLDNANTLGNTEFNVGPDDA